MALLTELKNRLLSMSDDQLVDLLKKPDEELRFSQLTDVSAVPSARLLRTELTDRADFQAKVVRRVITPILLERIGPARLLDDASIRQALDPQRMLARVNYLQSQMIQMNQRMTQSLASDGPLPPAKRILAFGLGGSAIGALIAREIIENQGYGLSLDIHTNYPATFHGIDSDTLVVLCSYSGNTEEVLHAFDYAVQRTKKLLILSRGGELGKLSEQYRFVEIPQSDILQPRESIGFWLGAFLLIVSAIGLATRDDGVVYRFQVSDVEGLKQHLDDVDGQCSADTVFWKNPAKQYATFFLHGTTSGDASSEIEWEQPRIPVVFLDDADRAIGKRLANQFGESVEHPIWLMVLCEDAHNEIESAATLLVEEELQARKSRSYILISSRPYDSSGMHHKDTRASQRMEATIETLFRKHDVDLLRIETEGDSVLERKLCLLKLLDYTRAYACILRGTNPIPVMFMDLMKNKMKRVIGAADRDLLRLLVESGKLPLSHEDALSDDEVKRCFPTLRHTILNRLIKEGHLAVDSGKLNVTNEGRKLLE